VTTGDDEPARLDVVLYADVAMAVVAPDLRPLRDRWAPSRPVPSFVPGSWLAVGTVGGHIVGCARVEPTPIPFPPDRSGAARGLRADQRDEWLAGGTELVELLVDPAARGIGIGSMLHRAVRATARDQRAWMSLAGAERGALPFFLGRGWMSVTSAGVDVDGSVVLLPESHPAVRAGPAVGGTRHIRGVDRVVVSAPRLAGPTVRVP